MKAENVDKKKEDIEGAVKDRVEDNNKNIVYAEDEDIRLFENPCGCEDPVDLHDD